MRIAEISAAQNAAAIEPLVFFAQCLAELLFDHTMDSYKAPALDTVSRALEVSALSRQANAHDRAVRALTPVIEELSWSLSNDPAIKGHERAMATRIVEQLKGHATETKKVAETTDALLLHLRNYWPS